MVIYVDESIVEAIKKDGKEVGPEAGRLLIGLNPRKYDGPLTVIAPYKRVIGSAAFVDLRDYEIPLIEDLERIGLYDKLTYVGWAHTHPSQGGHEWMSGTDTDTQTRFQNLLPEAIAIVGSRDGIEFYIMENDKYKNVTDQVEIVNKRKEFPQLEEILK